MAAAAPQTPQTPSAPPAPSPSRAATQWHLAAPPASKRVGEDQVASSGDHALVQRNWCQRFGRKNPLLGFSAPRPGLEARQFGVQDLGRNLPSIPGRCPQPARVHPAQVAPADGGTRGAHATQALTEDQRRATCVPGNRNEPAFSGQLFPSRICNLAHPVCKILY